MKNTQINKLFIKYIKRECSKDDIDLLINYFQSSEDLADVPTIEQVYNLIERLPNMDESSASRIKKNILEVARKDKKKQKKSFIRRSWFKYAAAAVLVIALASTYFLRDQIFGSSIEHTTPIIVNNQIEPGVDKATLTLETGETVALEKGTQYKTQNASSNGEEIIYQAGEKNNQDIAYNTLTIPRGGQFMMTLSDGTKVWLNSESQLKYPVSFIDGESRMVELVYGEAYFDVSTSTEHNGADFKVYNNNQEVQVLGTEFNIKAYKEEANIYTTLVEGKVSVTVDPTTNNQQLTTNNQQLTTKILAPGEQSKLNTNTKSIQISEVDTYREIAWRDGVFSFKHKTLKDIMASLSRWYDMDVVFQNKELENVTFNGNLKKEQSIEDILTFLKGTINTYEINNKTIILK